MNTNHTYQARCAACAFEDWGDYNVAYVYLGAMPMQVPA